MTEDKARTKWCPFVRAYNGVTDEGVAANRWAQGKDRPASTACIASECMAWRWHGGPSEGRGYCGLAGREP